MSELLESSFPWFLFFLVSGYAPKLLCAQHLRNWAAWSEWNPVDGQAYQETWWPMSIGVKMLFERYVINKKYDFIFSDSMKHVGICTLTTLWNYFYPCERVILWKISKPLCHRPSFASATATSVFSVFLLHYCSYVEAETKKCKIQSKIRYDTVPFPDRWRSFNSWSISTWIVNYNIYIYSLVVMDEAHLFTYIIQQSSQYVASTDVCLSRLFCILILHNCPTGQFQACSAAMPMRPCFSKGLERTGVRFRLPGSQGVTWRPQDLDWLFRSEKACWRSLKKNVSCHAPWFYVIQIFFLAKLFRGLAASVFPIS